jgi:hypothetical protein
MTRDHLSPRRENQKLYWYPLDGAWHPSVAGRLSALHLPAMEGQRSARCDIKKVLYLSDCFTEAEAKQQGRTLCKRCVKIGP